MRRMRMLTLVMVEVAGLRIIFRLAVCRYHSPGGPKRHDERQDNEDDLFTERIIDMRGDQDLF